MEHLPSERVRRSLTLVGQVRIGAVQKDGEDAYRVKVDTPDGISATDTRPATAGKITIPAAFRGDEDEYIVERVPTGIKLIPVADDYDERVILLEPVPQTTGQHSEQTV